MKKLILFLVICFVAKLSAQTPEVYISKEKVIVGEPFFLKYRIQLEDNDKIIVSKLGKLFPAERIASNSKMEGEKFMQIEILNSFDTLYLEKDGKHYWACEFQLVAWDTGLVVLNGLNYSINNSNSNFSSVFIESMLMKAEKGKVIEDIKEDYLTVNGTKSRIKTLLKFHLWWIIPFCILIAFIVYRLTRKPKKEVPEAIKTLKEQTIDALNALNNSGLCQKGEIKQHFIELSFLLRWYLSTRYVMNLLEKTTQETLLLLEAKKLPKELIDTILQILNHSDMVKFAGSSSNEEFIKEAFNDMMRIIIATSPKEEVENE